MIKLNNILNEIEVGLPLSKQDIINWWFNNDLHLFSQLTQQPTLDDLLKNYGVNDIDGFIDYNYDEPNDYSDNVKLYTEAYYNKFKPKEITVVMFERRDEIDIKGTPYKNIEIGNWDSDQYVYCNNF